MAAPKMPQVNTISKGTRPKRFNVSNKAKTTNRAESIKQDCSFCGQSHLPRRCPAWGATCSQCHGRNHFAQVCKKGKQGQGKKRPVRVIHKELDYSEYSSDLESQTQDLFIGSCFVGNLSMTSDKWQAPVSVQGKTLMFKLDTGAHANVLPVELYHKLRPNSSLQKTQTVLTAFGNTKIIPAGTATLECAVNAHKQRLKFYVTKATNVPILGQQACESLNLLKRVETIETPLTQEVLFQQYKDVFTGVGEYQEEYHIELDETVAPVIQPARKVPYARLQKLKETLDSLEKQNIIASVNKPTDWVSNLVIVEKKSGALRLCLDPKALNTAIKRERYTIPTPADVQSKFQGATTFTVLDMKDAFWHVKLSEPSSYLCTFSTPWGRKRFLRMPFGISSASEVLQKRNQETFGDIQRIHVIADDIIIATNDKDHDETVRKVMERAREKKVRFSKDKVQHRVPVVRYMGNLVSSKGLKPDKEKVKAIVEMPKPKDKKALQRLLGMVKYLAQDIPNESDITSPLRELLKEDTQWIWQPEHEKALQQIKEVLTSQPVLRFYDVEKTVQIQADTSQNGLGACLLQEGHPIAYASRTMTPAEVNYAQIEKEMLAMTYACDKFHHYIYGKQVDVATDHRPLEAIMKKTIAKAPPRLQRMMLKLQRYTLNVTYVPGKSLQLPDTLSRACCHELPSRAEKETADDLEVMVHSLITDLPASATRMEEIRHATETDPCLQMLAKTVKTGWPHRRRSTPPEIRQYWGVRNEVMAADGLLFLGDRLIIPSSLRSDMLQRIHEGHLGIEKCKARARAVMYWPGISESIKATVARCNICLKYRRSNQKEPQHSLNSNRKDIWVLYVSPTIQECALQPLSPQT